MESFPCASDGQGHTLYAVAIAFEADGNTVLATGDQQDGGWIDGERTEVLNFQYRNRFRVDDFVGSALSYRRLAPDLMISGHWEPRKIDDAYLDMLLAKGQELARLHRALLPLDEVDFGAEGFGARILPYRSQVTAGEALGVEVEVRNPFRRRCDLRVGLVVPERWQVSPAIREAEAGALGETTVRFSVVAPPGRRRRARLAANLTAGDRDFGHVCANLAPSGTFWGQWTASKGWGQSWTPVRGGLHARTLAEATLFLHRAVVAERAAGVARDEWLCAMRGNLDVAVKNQSADGNLASQAKGMLLTLSHAWSVGVLLLGCEAALNITGVDW